MRSRPGLRSFLVALPLVLCTALSDSAQGAAPKDAIASLPEEERKWLTEYAAPIILADEEKLFLQLTEAHQRDIFKEEFWKRRERVGLDEPLGPGYRDRYAQLRDAAATKYDGLESDTGRMVVRQGEPAGVAEFEACSEVFRQVEIWTYRNAKSSTLRQHLFYRPTFGGPRKLWSPVLGDRELLQPASCVTSLQQVCVSRGLPLSAANSGDPVCGGQGVGAQGCEAACRISQIAEGIRARQAGASELASLSQPPRVSTEGLDSLAQRLLVPNPDAKPVAVEGGLQRASLQQPPAEPSPKEARAALSEEERKWLTEFIAPIILPDEQKLFLRLTEPHQREIFKEEFWKRRERTDLRAPLGPGYKTRYEELRRLADEKYDGWRQDAGRMVIGHGEPDEVERLGACDDIGRDLEVWKYSQLGASGRHSAEFLFYRPTGGVGPRRLWHTGIDERELYTPKGRPSTSELAYECGLGGSPTRSASSLPLPGQQCHCRLFAIIQAAKAVNSPLSGQTEAAKLLAPPEVSTEGLDQIADRFPGLADAKAKALSLEGPSTAAAVPTSPSAKVSNAASTPAPARRKLSGKEVKELTAQLEPKYREFLQLVELIITQEEREVFLQISDNYQKDRFIESFWRRRSIDGQGIRNDYQAIHTRRVEMAREQFKNMNNDRAKIFIINGAPDAVVAIDCQDVYVPIQIWYYDRLESLKSKVYLIFHQPHGVGEYKLWLPLDGEGVLTVGGGIGGSQIRGGATRRGRNDERCFEERTLRQAIAYSTAILGSGASAMAGAAKLFQPPIIETEGVDQILTMTTELAVNSVPLALTKLLRFPEQRANKIAVDLSLLVPKSDLKARELGAERFYNVDVIGEVVKGERLIDNFKYRFDIPVDEIGGDKIPLTVRRYLYPGDYSLVLKVSDGNQNAEGRLSEKLTVPEQPDAPPPLIAAAREQARATIDRARDTGLIPSAIALLPIAKEIATGLQRFETKVAEGIRAVDFYLNGSKIMTKTRPPFEADLNLGPLPRKHTIRVVAYGPGGRAVGEDEYIVNEGREVFRVRIMAPEKGSKASGPTKVVAAVAVPEGRTLQKLEFYSNEARVATLYQPPFEQTVNIKTAKTLGYVRVVGTLEDGTVSEDVRYVNAPDYISEVTVDAVELYTTVTDKGRPVAGLQASNFKVYEDGTLQKIESFEYVKNLPLSLGLMVDTSASMLEALPEAQQAALTFLDFSIGPKDRAFTVSFDNEPYLLSKPTSRKDKLFRSLAGLRAEGSTALYDAIIYGLYQFTGIKGKKALVILSDGKDTTSKFDFETTLEYVRKSGISIYAIGLKITGTDLDVKYKLNKLAQVTGGQTFYVDSAKNLESVYRQINEDLRSQYLLTYYSTNADGKERWRKVEVKVEPTSLQARTLSGYYP